MASYSTSSSDLSGSTASNSVITDIIDVEEIEMRPKNRNPRHLNSYMNSSAASGEAVPQNLPVNPQPMLRNTNDRQEGPENAKIPDADSLYWFEKELKYCIKILRELEFAGHVETIFRIKFLTWFARKATTHERHVVNTFFHVFKADAEDLAEQLVDTFTDRITGKSPPPICYGENCSCNTLYKKPRH